MLFLYLLRSARGRKLGFVGILLVSLVAGYLSFGRVGDYRTEVSTWEAAVRADRTGLRVLNSLATSHLAAGNKPEAYRLLRESLRRDPLRVDTNTRLIELLVMDEHLDEAEWRAQQMLAIDPRLWQVKLFYGRIQRMRGQLPEAAVTLAEVAVMFPSSPSPAA